MRCYMQQKIQSAGCCPQPGKTPDVGELPDVETGTLPMSHIADTTPQDERIQTDSGIGGTDGYHEQSACTAKSLKKSPAAGVMIFLIRIYQKAISPYLPCQCRFEPSCSHYAIDAFRKRGFWMGMLLTAWRLMRCQPFCKCGFDPVPEKGFRSKTLQNHQNSR